MKTIITRKQIAQRDMMIPVLFIVCVVNGCVEGKDLETDAGDTDTVDSDSELVDTEYELEAEPDSGSPVSAVSIKMNEKVKTVLSVNWTQIRDADSAWLEFTFENGEWFQSPPKPAANGENREIMIGIPENTEVAFHVVTENDGITEKTVELSAATGSAPDAMPRPTVLSYDPILASEDRWLLGSVEKTPDQESYYYGTFWIYIIDRQGRIIWYYSDLADNPCMSFPRISPEGSYIYFEKRYWAYADSYAPRVIKMTLDWAYFDEFPVPGLEDAQEMTADGNILFNTGYKGDSWLKEISPDGSIRNIWNIEAWVGMGNHLSYTNTVNWNPLNDTVIMSFPYSCTAVEIDRATGEKIAQWGSLPYSWDFEPDSWRFQFNHYANITPQGTLLISSHMPGFSDTETPVAGQHAFMEFEIDRDNQTLVEKWIYNEGPEWAKYRGEAHRLANGNTLANYGTGGVIREITPDKETAWRVIFDAPFDSEDFFNNMVQHNILLNDLYALCEGPE